LAGQQCRLLPAIEFALVGQDGCDIEFLDFL
jgi:hypothetical protein